MQLLSQKSSIKRTRRRIAHKLFVTSAHDIKALIIDRLSLTAFAVQWNPLYTITKP